MTIISSIHETVKQPTDEYRKRGCLFYVGRGLAVLVILLSVLCLVGFVYETGAEAKERQAYAAPGQLLYVGGHRMHIQCMGEGSPTVILEAAGGHFSATWGLVQPQVAQTSRVCAYDRAGYGWSEPGPEPRDAGQIASELHTLLAGAGIEPPYVMVGHSVGGIYIRVFNAQYPGEVVGSVLVDATHPDNWTRQGESIESLQMMASVSAGLARIGLMRLFASVQNFGLPTEQNAALKANIASSQYWDTQRADTASMLSSLDQGRNSSNLSDMPLAVIAAADYPEGKGRDTELALQREIAALSTNSLYRQIDGAHHITLVTDPLYAPFVSEAIIQVIEAERTGVPLIK